MKRPRRKFALVFVTLAFAISLPQFAVPFAQPTVNAQVSTGKLKGIVVDWQYARVLNTRIVLGNESFKKETIVDQEGAYEVEVPPGSYLVKAQSPGFRQFRLKVDVMPNATKTLNIMLRVLPQEPVKCPKGALCL